MRIVILNRTHTIIDDFSLPVQPVGTEAGDFLCCPLSDRPLHPYLSFAVGLNCTVHYAIFVAAEVV